MEVMASVILPLLITLPPAAATLTGMALVFAILVAAGFFLIGYSLNNAPMIAVAREELATVVFTAMIIFFWLSLDSILNTAVIGLLLGSIPSQALSTNSCLNPVYAATQPSCVINGLTTSHLSIAIASLDIVEEKLKSQYLDLYLFEALIGFLSTVSFPLGSPVPAVNIISLSLSPFAGLSMLSSAHTIIVEAIGYLLSVVWGKEFILYFARDIVPLLLLPFGIFLRAFPFFRKTGSSVIALAFTLYYALPFAVLLSNYMIFDIYGPPDFAYTPYSATSMHTTTPTSNISSGITNVFTGSATGTLHNQFNSESIISSAQTDPGSECAGNAVVRSFCSFMNLLGDTWDLVKGFGSTVFSIWRFMMGFTGDFYYTFFNNPAFPGSASAGLFYFLILEVTTISPFIILIMFTTVLEIIITVTSYRGIALIIGGDAELIGLTKVI